MKRLFLYVLITICATAYISEAQVMVEETTETITLKNQFLTLGFRKNNADLQQILYKGKSLLNGRDQRAYLLGPGFSMATSECRIIRNTPELVEISFYHEGDNHFQYDLRYILKNNDAGVYCYLVQSHRAADPPGEFGQTRWGIRSDESLFDYHLVRDTIQGPMPKMAELKKENEIQDWTFRMQDGSVYTKYNFADYIEGRHVHGMAGTKSGLGMFVIQASHEYLNGGPTKQYQNVHSNPYLICMFNCGHFQSDLRKGDTRITDDWKKVQGPFLLYFNEGKSITDIWNNAKLRSQKEQQQWPYAWMQHGQYPLQRTTVSGILMLNKKPVQQGTTVVLASPGYDWQAQSKGYIYYTRTNEWGDFVLNHVRKGNYTLYAYGSNMPQEFQQKDVVVDNIGKIELGKLYWNTAKEKVIFQLGKADRKTDGFRYSNVARGYGIFDSVPAYLDFTMGIDDPAKEWYYAQTKKGEWNIHFDLQEIPAGKIMLNLALAGAAKNPTIEVKVNGEKVGEYKPGNDTGIYRSAVRGAYYQLLEWDVAFLLLKKGKNTITFSLPDVKPGGGIMYDAVKLSVQ